MAATRTTQQTALRAQKSKSHQRESTVQQSEDLDVRSHITELLRQKGALTRGDITVKTGIPRTTVYDTLMNLLLAGTIEKYVDRNGQRGRPSVFYQLVA